VDDDELDEAYNEAVILLTFGEEADMKRGAELLLKAADDGHAASKKALGFLYLDGRGVERDLKKAYELISEAAACLDPIAMYVLGRMYEGGLGVEQNDNEALFMFSFAAEMGIPGAEEDANRLTARVCERRERKLRSRPFMNLEISEDEVEAVCCKEMLDAVLSGEAGVSELSGSYELLRKNEDSVKTVCGECPFCGRKTERVPKNKIY
jgi:TPR repeat protein